MVRRKTHDPSVLQDPGILRKQLDQGNKVRDVPPEHLYSGFMEVLAGARQNGERGVICYHAHVSVDFGYAESSMRGRGIH